MDFSSINAFFDHIYILTIPAASERRENIQKNLDGLNFTFFQGIDKKDLDINELIQKNIYDAVLGKKNHPAKKLMRPGQIACAMGHKMIYGDIIKRGYDKVLILEDDVALNIEDAAYIQNVINALPPDWDLLFMDYCLNEVRKPFKQGWYHVQRAFGLYKWNHTMIRNRYPRSFNDYLKKAGYHEFADAYAITRKAAEVLLNLQTPVSFLADALLPYAITNNLLNGYISKIKIFKQLSTKENKSISSYIDD